MRAAHFVASIELAWCSSLSRSVAGIALGVAFAATNNLFVPIVAHFLLDLVSFCVCHVQALLRALHPKRPTSVPVHTGVASYIPHFQVGFPLFLFVCFLTTRLKCSLERLGWSTWLNCLALDR